MHLDGKRIKIFSSLFFRFSLAFFFLDWPIVAFGPDKLTNSFIPNTNASWMVFYSAEHWTLCTQCEYASEVKARMLKKSFVKRATRAVSLSRLYTYYYYFHVFLYNKIFERLLLCLLSGQLFSLLSRCIVVILSWKMNGIWLWFWLRVANCEEKLLLAML